MDATGAAPGRAEDHGRAPRLAMAGAPALAIKEMAGHASLTKTMRFMHLSPAANSAAIELLKRKCGETKGGRPMGPKGSRQPAGT